MLKTPVWLHTGMLPLWVCAGTPLRSFAVVHVKLGGSSVTIMSQKEHSPGSVPPLG